MDEVRIYAFKFKDVSGKESPHFNFVTAHMGKKLLIPNYATSVTAFGTRLEAKYYAMRMNKKDCLADEIARAEEMLDSYKAKMREIEHKLSVMKYLDADSLPEFEKKGSDYS